MITRAVLRYVRITPRKFRQIIPLVKGKRPEEAIAILMGVKKGASKYGIDVINSAINNARRKQGVDVSELRISNFVANGGPILKRFRAGSMGRASQIKKRTSHITVELDLAGVKAQGDSLPEVKASQSRKKAAGKTPAAVTSTEKPKSEIKKSKIQAKGQKNKA